MANIYGRSVTDIDLKNKYRVYNMIDPELPQDASTKSYVDDAIQGTVTPGGVTQIYVDGAIADQSELDREYTNDQIASQSASDRNYTDAQLVINSATDQLYTDNKTWDLPTQTTGQLTNGRVDIDFNLDMNGLKILGIAADSTLGNSAATIDYADFVADNAVLDANGYTDLQIDALDQTKIVSTLGNTTLQCLDAPNIIQANQILNMGNLNIENVADPSDPKHAVNKQFLEFTTTSLSLQTVFNNTPSDLNMDTVAGYTINVSSDGTPSGNQVINYNDTIQYIQNYVNMANRISFSGSGAPNILFFPDLYTMQYGNLYDSIGAYNFNMNGSSIQNCQMITSDPLEVSNRGYVDNQVALKYANTTELQNIALATGNLNLNNNKIQNVTAGVLGSDVAIVSQLPSIVSVDAEIVELRSYGTRPSSTGSYFTNTHWTTKLLGKASANIVYDSGTGYITLQPGLYKVMYSNIIQSDSGAIQVIQMVNTTTGLQVVEDNYSGVTYPSETSTSSRSTNTTYNGSVSNANGRDFLVEITGSAKVYGIILSANSNVNTTTQNYITQWRVERVIGSQVLPQTSFAYTSDINLLSSYRVVNALNGVNPQDYVTKSQMDALVTGVQNRIQNTANNTYLDFSGTTSTQYNNSVQTWSHTSTLISPYVKMRYNSTQTFSNLNDIINKQYVDNMLYPSISALGITASCSSGALTLTDVGASSIILDPTLYQHWFRIGSGSSSLNGFVVQKSSDLTDTGILFRVQHNLISLFSPTTFSNFAVTCATAPTTGNHLVNKTYCDARSPTQISNTGTNTSSLAVSTTGQIITTVDGTQLSIQNGESYNIGDGAGSQWACKFMNNQTNSGISSQASYIKTELQLGDTVGISRSVQLSIEPQGQSVRTDKMALICRGSCSIQPDDKFISLEGRTVISGSLGTIYGERTDSFASDLFSLKVQIADGNSNGYSAQFDGLVDANVVTIIPSNRNYKKDIQVKTCEDLDHLTQKTFYYREDCPYVANYHNGVQQTGFIFDEVPTRYHVRSDLNGDQINLTQIYHDLIGRQQQRIQKLEEQVQFLMSRLSIQT